jgi:peptidoglycan endopeptidase LytE
MTALRRVVVIVVLALGLGVGGLAVPTVVHADNSTTYVVVDGDTLIGIAAKSGVRLSELLRENDLQLTSLILPGQRLDIPSSTSSTSSTPTGGSTSSTPNATNSSSLHVVRWGDTLSGIAGRYGVSLASLLRANQLSVSSLITPGMKLVLPGGATGGATGSATTPPPTSDSPSPTPTSSGSTHVVRAGDTLSGIAARYGVSLGSLLRDNSMTVTSLIVPGMRIALPAGSTGGSTNVPSSPPAPQPSATTGVSAVVNYALAQVGKPYRFFSKGPDSFDCSGLTLAAYAQIGVDLVHFSAWQARQGTAVDFRNAAIQPGDLVFQERRGSDTINHVGIAVTSTTWVQAVGTGKPVSVGPLPSLSTITAVRRYVG